MRQRKVKDLEQKYEQYSEMLVYEPSALRGKWRERIGDANRLYLEIGCGKGRFISQIAEKHPQDFYIAIEGNRSVMLRAMEKVQKLGLTNVIFIPEFITDLREWFADGEVDGIYLNFSDPLPKTRTARQRLTYRVKLKQYFDVLKEEGRVTFKTDNTGLFEYTVQEVRAADLLILDLTRDLYAGTEEEQTGNIVTEYEEKFSAKGETIKRMIIGRRTAKGEEAMGMAAINGRSIPKEDKVFGISGRAKAAVKEKGKEKVINGTIGALLDDEGELIVLSSVDEAVKALEPKDYAEYAPIAGIPGFRDAVIRSALGDHKTDRTVSVVATPGGTGSIRNTIDNYSCPGDAILTHDWYWPNYKSIADELGRSLETFRMFDEKGDFDFFDFEYKVKKLLRHQDHLVLILNTPANNPTGYSLSDDEWREVVRILNALPEEKKVALLIDIAYIDFAGEPEEVRSFLPVIEDLHANILPILAYSASKAFTFYGFRCAAMVAMAKNPEDAKEFEFVASYACRATWSNAPRGPQSVIAKIYSDPALLARVEEERKGFRDMLLHRGRAFEEEAKRIGLPMVPFRGGFFVSIPCENSDEVSRRLEAKDAFLVPMAKGLRASVASISEEKCRRLPALIKEALEEETASAE